MSRYTKSEKLLKRALKSIPLGTQTFSKSKTQYPFGVSPYYIERAKGSHVWDADGNKYIDFVNSLAAVTLGYGDPDVTKAVRGQLDKGNIFSLPHRLEIEVSEKIIKMVPCAQKVRFGKNGSDVTAAAVRVARAFTNRDHILACGYHGWQDWYIGATSRNKGVPEAVRQLTHLFKYNDLESLHKLFKEYPNQVAAVIMEPMSSVFPEKGFLENVKDLAKQQGAVFILDETITGFRFKNGGAQEYFHVTPDLATFGKGMANGYPLSAVTGRSDIMALMEEVFFSFTFGGETLSLAACAATLEKLSKKPVINQLAKQGEKIINGTEALIKEHQLAEALSISGHPSWSFLNFKDVRGISAWVIRTLFYQEVFKRGVLTLGAHNMSFAHSNQDIDHLLKTYDAVFGILSESIKKNNVKAVLNCEPLEPLFRIR